MFTHWPNFIIDDFFSETLFQKLASFEYTHVEPADRKLNTSRVYKDGSIEVNGLEESLVECIHNEKHDFMTKLLTKIDPSKPEKYFCSNMHVVITGKDYVFPIHDDTPKKLLSGIVYLAPERNTGTLLYSNQEGEGRYEVPWKQNRACIFSHKKNTTWHSYEGDGHNNRLALVYNLMESI